MTGTAWMMGERSVNEEDVRLLKEPRHDYRESGTPGLPEIGGGFTSVVDPEFSRERLRES